MSSIRVLRYLALLLVGALVASCTGTDTTASTTSSTTTTLSDSTTTTTITPAECIGDGFSVDLDGIAGDELVVLRDVSTGGSRLEICQDGVVVSARHIELPDTELLGVVDLGDGGVLDILLETTVGDRVEIRAVMLGLSGLAHTDVLAEWWIDAPADGVRLFEARGFECADIDDDGDRELLTVTYLPADTMETGGVMHVEVGVVLVDGEVRVEGIDAYETDLAIAYDRLIDDSRCAPEATAKVEVRSHGNGWDRLDAGDTFMSPGNLIMTGIAHSVGRYVMVGAESPSPLLGEFFEMRPSIWHSTDAVRWVEADLGDAIGDVRAVTALPDGAGFVAVGTTGLEPRAWISPDGITWNPVAMPAGSDDLIGLIGPVVSAVMSTPLGLVAVGTEDYAPFSGEFGVGSDLDAAVWISADGREWRRIEDAAFGTAGYQPNTDGEFNSEAVDVAWVPGVGLVVIGSASESDPSIDYPQQTPVAWVSADGIEWLMHRLDVDARLRGVSAFDGGLVAFGVDGIDATPTNDAVVLTSADGIVWERADGDFGGLSDPDGIQAVNGAVPIPGVGVIAIGSDEIEIEARGGAAVWWSADGRAWDRAAHDDGAFEAIDVAPTATMTSAVWDGARLIVVGFTGRQIEYSGGITGCCVLEPAVWYWSGS
jgi:hypothetical protein